MKTTTQKKTAKKDHTLYELLVQKLQSLYDIETVLVRALPKMVAAATDPDLKQNLRVHLNETRTHVVRIEDEFEILGEKPKKLKVEAIRGLVKDGEWVIKNVSGDDALDANLITIARYIEHYEIAGYIGAKKWAKLLQEEKVCLLLEETLAEEKAADEKLNGNSLFVNIRVSSKIPE